MDTENTCNSYYGLDFLCTTCLKYGISPSTLKLNVLFYKENKTSWSCCKNAMKECDNLIK